MIQRSYLTTLIRKYLNEGNFIFALIRCSVDLEILLAEKLFFEKGIKWELIDVWTLNKYILWNIKLELIDSKYNSLLNDFNTIRNKILHRRTFVEKIMKDKKAQSSINSIILSVCDFIDSTSINYPSNQEVEREYSEIFTKIDREYENFILKQYELKVEKENEPL